MSEKSKIRFLLADDEAYIRTIIRQLFISTGAEQAAEASNGEEALAAFEAHKPDITLLDVILPRLDGKAAPGRIMEKSAGAFVVMLTTLQTMETAKECVKMGAASYIRKDAPQGSRII